MFMADWRLRQNGSHAEQTRAFAVLRPLVDNQDRLRAERNNAGALQEFQHKGTSAGTTC